MRVYVAAPFADRDRARVVAVRVEEEGHRVVARWLDSPHVFDAALTDEQRVHWAGVALEDIDESDVILSLTLPAGTKFVSGGRHVELGYAMARNKTLIVVGDRENVFHYLSEVKVFSDVDDMLEYLYDLEHTR